MCKFLLTFQICYIQNVFSSIQKKKKIIKVKKDRSQLKNTFHNKVFNKLKKK